MNSKVRTRHSVRRKIGPYHDLAALLYGDQQSESSSFLLSPAVREALQLPAEATLASARDALLADMPRRIGLATEWRGFADVPPAAMVLWCRLRDVDEQLLPHEYRSAADFQGLRALIDEGAARQSANLSAARAALHREEISA
jgi:hypothetical protein